jgi:hypothetical protein
MAPVLWLIAVLSNVTVIHRIVYTRQEARRQVPGLREQGTGNREQPPALAP